MRQDSLFDGFGAQAAGLITRIKVAMARSVEESGLSREQALDRMNALAQSAGVKLTGGSAKDLSLATFEKWLNPAERDHIPGILAINTFCAALGDTTVLATQLAMHGCEVMVAADRFERDYGRACLAEKRARKKKRLMEADL